MTIPLMSGVGGPGTGRPNIFARLGGFAGRALPRIFGADPSVQMDPEEQRLALRNALMNAGTGMAVAAGGPRSWGEFGPSPIASVLMGLNAGREGYQGAQSVARERQRRTAAYSGLLGAATDPETAPLYRAMQSAAVAGDHEMFSSLQKMITDRETSRYGSVVADDQGYIYNTKTGEARPIDAPAPTNAPSTLPRRLQNQAWTARREFLARPDNAAMTEVGRNYAGLERQLDLIDQTKNGTAAAGAINQLVRMFDPNSVVREGEAARYGNAPYSLYDRLTQMVTRVTQGAYSPEITRQIRESVRELARTYRAIYDERMASTRSDWNTIYGVPGETLPLGNNPIPLPPGNRAGTSPPGGETRPSARAMPRPGR